MSLAVQFENVGKQYRLGEVGVDTLKRDAERLWAKMRGKPDPYETAGVVNDRAVAGGEYVWALKDVNLEIEQGEVFGIIGHNGAGKSTLLKLLSRVTAPTTGRIRSRGRIASLLEVGTGFHPELTGRENIYLNGAILGMSKGEIKKRLDQIVEFSGCAKYIDTPTKRYSSGMTVRLGFAVAANLECEILAVDEVLAVGDQAFQKRCIGRMSEAASNGRTVLFVSHNMQSVEQLCTRACVIERGQITMVGGVSDAVTSYFGVNSGEEFTADAYLNDERVRRGNGDARFEEIRVETESGREVSAFTKGDKACVNLTVRVKESIDSLRCFIRIHSGITHQEVTSLTQVVSTEPLSAGEGKHFSIEFDTSQFRAGIYPLLFEISDSSGERKFDIVDKATRPLSIVGSGEGRVKGVIDVESQVVTPANMR